MIVFTVEKTDFKVVKPVFTVSKTVFTVLKTVFILAFFGMKIQKKTFWGDFVETKIHFIIRWYRSTTHDSRFS